MISVMPSNESLPHIGDCVPLFQQVCRTFNDEWFTVEDLYKILRQELDDGRNYEENELDDHLNQLVTYGLLRRDAQHRYRIWCRLGESVDDWHAKIKPQVEALHRLVHATERPEGTYATNLKITDIISYKGETYRGIFVGKDTEFQDLASILAELLNQNSDHANIVLRSPANEASTVQGIADRLRDTEVLAEPGALFRFEKENSEVVGEDKDDLEFRLFLAPEPL